MWMEQFSRVVFCLPRTIITERSQFNNLPKSQRILHTIAFCYDLVDLVDAMLDIWEAIQMLYGEFKFRGFMLLCGILLARAIAVTGKYVFYTGGLVWVPFFQDTKEFMKNLSIDQQNTVKLINVVLFTELSIFLFEDSTLLLVWIYSSSFDRDDIFDLLNALVTCLSTLMGMTIFFTAIAVSLRKWCWKPSCCSRLCQIIYALSFCIVFGVVVAFLGAVLFFGLQTITRGEDMTEILHGNFEFFLLVCFSWTLATLFSCRLRLHAASRYIPEPVSNVVTVEDTNNPYDTANCALAIPIGDDTVAPRITLSSRQQTNAAPVSHDIEIPVAVPVYDD